MKLNAVSKASNSISALISTKTHRTYVSMVEAYISDSLFKNYGVPFLLILIEVKYNILNQEI